MGIIDKIIATANMVGADTPAYLEVVRLTALLVSGADQDRLKAEIPGVEALEDDAHRKAQED